MTARRVLAFTGYLNRFSGNDSGSAEAAIIFESGRFSYPFTSLEVLAIEAIDAALSSRAWPRSVLAALQAPYCFEYRSLK